MNSQARNHLLRIFTIEIPLAEGEEEKGGWTIEPTFLRQIEEKTRQGEHVYEEAIEEVILALFGIPMNPKALPSEPQFG